MIGPPGYFSYNRIRWPRSPRDLVQHFRVIPSSGAWRCPGHRQAPEEGMTRKCWTKSLGERGHRIRLYEKYPGGPIMRSVYIDGKEVRKSLAHRDKEKATRQGRSEERRV